VVNVRPVEPHFASPKQQLSSFYNALEQRESAPGILDPAQIKGIASIARRSRRW
jgi:hypothetical protein